MNLTSDCNELLWPVHDHRASARDADRAGSHLPGTRRADLSRNLHGMLCSSSQSASVLQQDSERVRLPRVHCGRSCSGNRSSAWDRPLQVIRESAWARNPKTHEAYLPVIPRFIASASEIHGRRPPLYPPDLFFVLDICLQVERPKLSRVGIPNAQENPGSIRQLEAEPTAEVPTSQTQEWAVLYLRNPRAVHRPSLPALRVQLSGSPG